MTSAPPNRITIIGLFNTYFPIARLILWHLPEQFIVPPSAIITWNSGAGYTKQLRTLANLQWMKLWVLLESINAVTLFFLMYPSIMRVWRVLIPANAWQDMVGVISSEVSSSISSKDASSWDASSSFGSSYSQSM